MFVLHRRVSPLYSAANKQTQTINFSEWIVLQYSYLLYHENFIFPLSPSAQGWRRPHIFGKFEGPVPNCRSGTHCEY